MNNKVTTLEKQLDIVQEKQYIYQFIKRSFDILCSLIGLLLMLPIAFIIKVMYMATGDFTSIFFVQDRIGKNGKEFRFFKFRSMCKNADQVLEKVLKEDKELAKEYKINKKLKDDPRITKVGKVIRKLSLDEVPQFINVFLGDMTMIGNRPYLPREKEDMGDYFDDIVKTKPGLTGYWQVNGRSDVSFQKRLELEQFYSNNAGLRLDIKIFFKTFQVVLGTKGSK